MAEGRLRPQRIETLRGSGELGSYWSKDGCGSWFTWKVRERRRREAVANVEARRPQEVKPQGRLGDRAEVETPARSDFGPRTGAKSRELGFHKSTRCVPAASCR